jgi:4-hydroxybenzoyl-CoA thioesterase
MGEVRGDLGSLASVVAPQPPVDGPALYRVAVEFGDCDPAGIVYFPNFYRWMDAASRHWFVHRGYPTWRETEAAFGLIGTPIVDAQTRFIKPALYGEQLLVETQVLEWRRSSFVQRHRIWRGSELLVEGTEVRVFAARREDGPGIRAMAVPEAVKAL